MLRSSPIRPFRFRLSSLLISTLIVGLILTALINADWQPTFLIVQVATGLVVLLAIIAIVIGYQRKPALALACSIMMLEFALARAVEREVTWSLTMWWVRNVDELERLFAIHERVLMAFNLAPLSIGLMVVAIMKAIGRGDPAQVTGKQ